MGSYPAVSPLPWNSSPKAVCFLWHFPWDRSPWALPSILPFGARTFLPFRRVAPGRNARSPGSLLATHMKCNRLGEMWASDGCFLHTFR